MANTKVLNLERTAFADVVPGGYFERLELDRIVSDNADKVDAFSGLLSQSMTLDTFVSGNVAEKVGQVVNADIGLTNRIILQTIAFAQTSGSGGVTSIDVQTSSSAGWASIYGNAAMRANVSSSLQNYGIARSVSSGTLWLANTPMRVVLLAAAGDATAPNAQNNLTVKVFWKPSGSYGT